MGDPTALLPMHVTFGASATAACIAEACTLPLDTAKVRLQLQSLAKANRATLKYKGPFHTVKTMVMEEGVVSLFNGLAPGLHRQFLFTGIRIGLYDQIKAVIVKDSEKQPLIVQRIGIAVLTSAVGITVANPADVLKVRRQALISANRKRLPKFSKFGTMKQYLEISKEEGFVAGLYKGFSANLVRNSIISASEIVSYGIAKDVFIGSMGFQDGMPVHLASGCFAGFMATAFGSPFDVIGTKVMQKRGPYAGLPISTVALQMMRNEGIFSFYKGFWPNFCRIGSFNILMWLSYEQIKKSIYNIGTS
mmetsp:Transcript_11816/g.30170  ORF Transcript_11816/g.30170 Transcript_11816/m.30170 type:complete len:306 (+) Transcript_11816:192-1109(+)|eukprot:CAMPEP_0198239714 /NCGR_PEP_ID=MMETSP1446-20131203/5049_1 /TAXON_ID=1461542 ORGANISM="Unidentified sp, Strain CCMP2111" /NCGR_SAMPLE_ID=MMETSP1446 /ASSEMBLY_ACC=CAM_ASM_001112 /LENGTH=305 /DNA_ID=CAMNT_0043922349 /DNA_START=175 /DNA_END=1092 /DNA_ORIENTATION=+